MPAALLLSAFLPQAITPLLMLGGLYLAFEGYEKVHHMLTAPSQTAQSVKVVAELAQGDKALFWIPEQLAYGGTAGAPKGMLVYEVELLSVVR